MILPLTTTKEGETVRVSCLNCRSEDTCRLQELGCVEGVSGVVISNKKNVIFQVGECRLAITAPLAKNILVEPIKIT
jgi:Fe2+ transport system protein FeoA